MTEAETKLLLIARLRAELQTLHLAGRIPKAELESRGSELDRLNLEAVGTLDDLPLDELLRRCERSDLGVDLSSFQAQLIAADSARVRSLRAEAQREGLDHLDLSSLYPGIRRVPLRQFDWKATSAAFAEVLLSLNDPHRPFDQVVVDCQSFFANADDFSVPAGLPKLSRKLVQRLIRERAVGAAQAAELIEDIADLERALSRRARDFSSVALSSGTIDPPLYDPPSDIALRFLTGVAASLPDDGPLDIDALIIQWPGPSFAALATAWLLPTQGETEARRRRKRNLLFARAGLGPDASPATVRLELERRDSEERWQQGMVLRQIGRNKTLYELALALSGRSLLGDGLQSRWQPVLERLRALGPVPEPEPVPEPKPVAEPKPVLGAELPPAPVPAPSEPAPETGTEELHEVLGPVPEYLEAAPARRSAEDRRVEAQSAWNVYLRPFLNENWLGLVGVFSLMAAWMFLTMWLWDKGQYFRILTGGLPLLVLTLGSASVSRFLERHEQASARAVGLFSSLCLLSVPFNFALAASILNLGSATAIAITLALALVYGLAIPWIARHIAPSFGHNPRRFLVESNFLILLPPAALWVAGVDALGATLFLSYLALVRGLHKARRESASFTFCWTLFTTAFLIANAILHIYYRQPLHAATLGVLLQLVAPAVSFFGRHSATSVAVSGGVSLFGVLLCLDKPLALLLSVLLATAFWLYQRLQIRAPWPDEAVALHCLGLAAAAGHFLKVSPGTVPLFLVPAIVAIAALEQRRRSTEVLTYGLPLLMVGAVVGDSLAPARGSFFTTNLLLISTFCYAYHRYAGGYRVPLWFLNVFLFAGLLFVSLRAGSRARLRRAAAVPRRRRPALGPGDPG